MITFRVTNQNFSKDTFITRKKTPIAKAICDFGFIHHYSNNHTAVVWWFHNFIKAELTFTVQELKDNCKSIYPYYNSKYVRGNIWKYSYTTLLAKICKEKGFLQVKVDKIRYKKTPKQGANVIISDAVYVLSKGLTKLQGRIRKCTKNTFTIRTEEGEFVLLRNSFTLLPQDDFIVLSIRV